MTFGGPVTTPTGRAIADIAAPPGRGGGSLLRGVRPVRGSDRVQPSGGGDVEPRDGRASHGGLRTSNRPDRNGVRGRKGRAGPGVRGQRRTPPRGIGRPGLSVRRYRGCMGGLLGLRKGELALEVPSWTELH